MNTSPHDDFMVPRAEPERRVNPGGRRADDLNPAQQAAIADAVRTFGDIVSAQSEETAALLQLIESCRLLLSEAEYSIIMRENGGAARVLAASSPEVRAVDELQVTTGLGPSIDAFEHGGQVSKVTLADPPETWRHFANLVGALDFKRLYAVPLRPRSEVIGILTVYARAARDTSSSKMAWIRTLATGAAASLDNRRSNAQLNELARQLQGALDSRVLVEQAKGMIGAQLGVTVDAAFEVLRSYSRSHNYRVQQVAADLLDKRVMIDQLTAPKPKRGSRSTP